MWPKQRGTSVLPLEFSPTPSTLMTARFFRRLQEAFEEALIRNNTFHEAKLRRVNSHAEERSARRTEAAIASLSAAAAASFGVQRRQADAAVAAVAAAGAHAQHQQASVMAAQAAMFVELQARTPGLLIGAALPDFANLLADFSTVV